VLLKGFIMTVTANEVKQRGVGVFDEILEKFSEAIITLRGKKKYVVMDFERYNKLREAELELAYMEVMKDYENGDYHTDIERHFKEIENV
jgi:PHD/YefM family antitoxin component YafN of YafNO toxin-antitoxin module